jgi:hypothetical protein
MLKQLRAIAHELRMLKARIQAAKESEGEPGQVVRDAIRNGRPKQRS